VGSGYDDSTRTIMSEREGVTGVCKGCGERYSYFVQTSKCELFIDTVKCRCGAWIMERGF
jgi:hypothetical protein